MVNLHQLKFLVIATEFTLIEQEIIPVGIQSILGIKSIKNALSIWCLITLMVSDVRILENPPCGLGLDIMT